MRQWKLAFLKAKLKKKKKKKRVKKGNYEYRSPAEEEKACMNGSGQYTQ